MRWTRTRRAHRPRPPREDAGRVFVGSYGQLRVVERHIITVTVVLVTIPGTSQGTPIKILAVVPKAKQTPAARGRGTAGHGAFRVMSPGLLTPDAQGWSMPTRQSQS